VDRFTRQRPKWSDLRSILHISSNTFHQRKSIVFVTFVIIWESCMSQRPPLAVHLLSRNRKFWNPYERIKLSHFWSGMQAWFGQHGLYVLVTNEICANDREKLSVVCANNDSLAFCLTIGFFNRTSPLVCHKMAYHVGSRDIFPFSYMYFAVWLVHEQYFISRH